MALIEKFVCQLQPAAVCTKDWLFQKKQDQSERLSPIQAASQAILRVHGQLLVWNYDEVANPTTEIFDLTADENEWVPVMTKLLYHPLQTQLPT